MTDISHKLRKDYVGPCPDPGVSCRCGLPAAAKCEGCNQNFCRQHWWKHSHAKERPNETQRD
jgi:hypothetical protein